MAVEPDVLEQFIEDAGLSYKQNSVSYIFECPNCRKKDKLFIRKRDGRFICWFCATTEGYQGRPEIALSDLTQRPRGEVCKALYGSYRTGPTLSLDLRISDYFNEDELRDPDAIEVPTMQMPYDVYPIDHTFSKRGAEYLAGRGIPLEVASRYHLQYAPARRRVVFPVELDGRLVGWQERLIIPNKYWNDERQRYVEVPKMLSSKGIPTANVVMFADRLKGSEHVIVCEGPIDAIKADLCGGNIATMGKAIGPGQVKTIKDPSRLTRQHVGLIANSGIKKVYLALDPDAASETARLVRQFSDLEVYRMCPPAPYKDLGEMGFQEVRDLFDRADKIGPGRMFLRLSTGR
jgi:hypothetical protein